MIKKYALLLAVCLFTFGVPMTEAAPKKGKKAKAAKVAADDFSIVSPSEMAEAAAKKKSASDAASAKAAKEAERLAGMSGEERREENAMLIADTKYYIENQKKTLKILRSVRNEKSAEKAVKPLEKIYGQVIDEAAAEGTLTALGEVKIMEEDEEKLPVHQASRATAAALNKAINKELSRLSQLDIQHAKFNGAIKNMIEQQR